MVGQVEAKDWGGLDLERSVVDTIGYEMDALVMGWSVVFAMPHVVLRDGQVRAGRVDGHLERMMKRTKYDSDETVVVNDDVD